MILADFNNQYSNNTRNNHHKPNQQVMRNTNNLNNTQNSNAISQSIITTNNNKHKHKDITINQYITQLDIPGVKQAYSKKQQQKLYQLNQTLYNQKQSHLQQSINRLYSTNKIINKNKNNKALTKKHQQQPQLQSSHHQNQNNQNQQQHQHQQSPPQNTQYYNQLYEYDSHFDHNFRVKKLQTQCKQLYSKLYNQFTNKYYILIAMNEKDKQQKQYKKLSLKPTDPKSKKIIILKQQVQNMFIKSIITYLITKLEQLLSIKQKKSSQFISQQDQLFISYSDYLNHFQLKQWNNIQFENQINNQSKSREFDNQLSQKLTLLAHKLPIFYYLLKFDRLQQQINQGKIKTINDLEQLVKRYTVKDNNNYRRDWQLIYKLFQHQFQVKFTVPFQNKLYQIKNNNLQPSNNYYKQLKDNHIDDIEIETYQKFKANPIPSTTYQKPSSSQKIKKPTTQPIPFNFTQTHSSTPNPTPQQYYAWNRQFKAKPIPKTLYQPQIIGITQKQRQQFKKQHQQKLYHEAKFPKTMNYLQNFNQFQQEKKKQLQQKYQQNRFEQRAKPKQIPEFDKLHKRDMHMLETKKQMNRTYTQPKPFKFSQTRKSDTRNTLKNTFYDNQEFQKQFNKTSNKLQKQQSNNQQQLTIIAKSTAKYDAYVKLRKQQKQQKQKQHEYKQQIKKRQEQDKKKYKDILRQRMHNQLSNQPKAIQYNYGNGGNNNNITNNMMRVNLQQIYIEKPLLMESNSKGKKFNDDSRTCFTDQYQPII